MVPDNSTGIPRAPAYSGARSVPQEISPTGLSPSMARLSRRSGYLLALLVFGSYNPGRSENLPVWAFPRSIASTGGIVVTFFSCGYLDVSVPRVRPPAYRRGDGIAPAGLPHSDIRGCCGYLPLTAAFRSLSRPSSPPRAQASPMRPCYDLFFLLFVISLFAFTVFLPGLTSLPVSRL